MNKTTRLAHLDAMGGGAIIFIVFSIGLVIMNISLTAKYYEPFFNKYKNI